MQNLFSTAFVLAIGYALLGVFVFDIYPEHIILSSAIVIIACLLPDIDGSSDLPQRELGGLLAAVSPLVLLEFFPNLETGGISRVALIVICCYALTRLLISRGLHRLTVPKGMIHSVPAAIITFELVFLLFDDLNIVNRLFVSSAAFVGFFSHLVIEAYGNLDLLGKALGNERKHTPVLKFMADSWGRTIMMYGCVFGLGWLVLRDFYPGLSLNSLIY